MTGEGGESMETVIFEGNLALGDGKSATMVFAHDFRVEQCAVGERSLTVECAGVQILGPEEHREVSSHPVYLDNVLIGRLDADRKVFTVLPEIEAGLHRVSIHVSPFPGYSLCDDFTLERVVLTCKE
jgi:hypothetical protein